MKVYFLLILLLVFAGVCAAQRQPSMAVPADLTVISHRCYLTINEKGAGSDPYQAINDQQQFRSASADETAANPSSAALRGPIFNYNTKLYRYEAKMKNTGQKTITGIMWRYRFLKPSDNALVGEYTLSSKVKISPGKTQKITADSYLKPRKKNSKKEKDNLEQISIYRIEYEDGTLWKAY